MVIHEFRKDIDATVPPSIVSTFQLMLHSLRTHPSLHHPKNQRISQVLPIPDLTPITQFMPAIDQSVSFSPLEPPSPQPFQVYQCRRPRFAPAETHDKLTI